MANPLTPFTRAMESEMTVIWKFPFAVDHSNEVTLEMPAGAQVLFAGYQGEMSPKNFVCWAQVNPDAPKVLHQISIYGTGHEMEEATLGGRYLNTFFMGPLVFHAFDLGEPE